MIMIDSSFCYTPLNSPAIQLGLHLLRSLLIRHAIYCHFSAAESFMIIIISLLQLNIWLMVRVAHNYWCGTDNERPGLLLSSDVVGPLAMPMSVGSGPERDRLCNVAEMISTFFCFLPPPPKTIWFIWKSLRARAATIKQMDMDFFGFNCRNDLIMWKPYWSA